MAIVQWMKLDSLLQATREKPGNALCIAAGTGIIIGIFASPWVFSATAKRRIFALSEVGTADTNIEINRQGQETHRDFNLRSRDNVSVSGASTPASTVSGGPHLHFLSKELDDRLDYSLALVYRHDLQLGKGRLVALCAQAALGQFKKLWKGKDEDLKLWEKGAKRKLCLEAEDEAHLNQVELLANQEGLPTFKVKDISGNGRRSVAVMAIGPAKTTRIQEVTSDLKQLL